MRPLGCGQHLPRLVERASLPDQRGSQARSSTTINPFDSITYCSTIELERAALAKREISQKWQIDAGSPGKVIVNRVRAAVGLISEFEQRQRKIGGDRQVEFGFAEGRNNHRSIADAARDLLPVHI